MVSELLLIKFDKIMQSKTYSCIVMASQQKKFGIYTDPAKGKIIQQYITNIEKPRPMTHDLISLLLRGADIKVKQVVINDLQETTYFARIFFEQKMGEIINIVEIDARPSDCITLALINKVPIYCTSEVLDRVVPLIEEM